MRCGRKQGASRTGQRPQTGQNSGRSRTNNGLCWCRAPALLLWLSGLSSHTNKKQLMMTPVVLHGHHRAPEPNEHLSNEPPEH